MICKTCGKEFYDKKHKNRVNCSKKCSNQALKKQITKNCQICNKEYSVPKSRIKSIVCSSKCRWKYMTQFSGNKASHWKGGRIHMKNGYISVRIDKKYVYEHRYIMEKKIGRKIKKTEAVHHINGNKKDNRIENLIILCKKEHDQMHLVPFKKGYDRRRKYNSKLLNE